MSKLLDLNKIKKDFTTNLNQSDKFENTKGILQNFKNFCNDNKMIISPIGASIFALLIQSGIHNYQVSEDNKRIAQGFKESDEIYQKSMQRIWDEYMDDPSTIAGRKEMEKMSRESEINYDFSKIDSVTEKAPNNDEKVTRLNKLKI